MIVTVTLYATLRDRAPDTKGVVELNVPEGTTVTGLIERLDLPAGIVRKVFIGGIARDDSYVLAPGDEVGMFPPIAGGR